MADFSLARSTSIGDPSSGPPQQQPTIESSPPTLAPGDADAGVASARPESASLTAKQKRELVAELLKATPERSNRQIAAIAKVTHKVVAAVGRQMESTEQIAQLTATIGKDGKARTARPGSPPAGVATDAKPDTNPGESERCEPNSGYAAEPPTVAGDGDVGAHPEAASAAPKSVQAPEVERREPEAAAAAKESSAQQVQPAIAEDIANRETAAKLALRIWAAIVAGKVLNAMSGLMDELIQSPLLDDEDEEVDEDWLDDHRKREKQVLSEAITDALDTYPDIDSINNLPPSSDPDVAQAAGQLKDYLAKCPIGATEFKEEFSLALIERMVKREIEIQFKKRPNYSEHIRTDVPGRDIKRYSSRGCTSSTGTFYKSAGYLDGGGLDALLTNGWTRVAKDRIDPVAWSHQHGMERKTERQNWRHHFLITERNGKQSRFELPREKLVGNGVPAARALMKSGVHVVAGAEAQEALVRYLRFKPKREIVRVPQVGFFEVDGYYICVRSNETLLPPFDNA